MKHRIWFNRATKSESERGAALVELAMVLTFLMLLVMGIFEIGTAWNTSQGVTQASRDGARVGSQLAVRGETDYEILKSIEASLGSDFPLLTRVVVFESDVSGQMPTACRTAAPGYSGGANCNVYGPTHFAALASPAGPQWGSGSMCGSSDQNWCSATERIDGPSITNLTNLGVHVEVGKSSVTQLFGSGPIQISETTVMRVEPGS